MSNKNLAFTVAAKNILGDYQGDGYCFCDIIKTKVCPCEEIKNAPVGSVCECGVYEKLGEKDAKGS